MPTFKFDPEGGEKVKCLDCGVTGIVEKVLRGQIYVEWKKSGMAMRRSVTPWSKYIHCDFCGGSCEETR